MINLPPEDQPPGEVFAPSTDESAMSKVGEQVLSNPSFVAFCWWAALAVTDADDEARESFHSLSFGGAADWNYDEARERIAGMSPIVPATKTHPNLAYVKFVDDPGENLTVINDAPIEACIVSMVLCDDGSWRVARVGGNALLPEDFE
ncbi:hypothetical protein [Nocardioides aromaticivorans]|nr:hypothetical protein [Nocardioides aromaticivorans]